MRRAKARAAMDAKDRDEHLLIRALGIDQTLAPIIARRIDELSGLGGVWTAGAASMEGVLDDESCDRLGAICDFTERLLESPQIRGSIDSAEAVAEFFRPRLALDAQESFWVLMLDARGRPLSTRCIAKGTLTACLVHPREVFAPALRARAASIIVVHNHPSGDPTPSDEDGILTDRLCSAGELLGIPVLDHVVVAKGGYHSIGPMPPEVPLCTPRISGGRS